MIIIIIIIIITTYDCYHYYQYYHYYCWQPLTQLRGWLPVPRLVGSTFAWARAPELPRVWEVLKGPPLRVNLTNVV